MEHLQHFGLSQDPFSNEPDLRFWFESAVHRHAQLRVERGLRQHKGLTLLTGDGGMGKTLLSRRILDDLEEEVFEATLLVMLPGAADATGILQRFARQIGCEEPAQDRAGLLGQIYEQLAIVREDGRHAVLMIDDAQIMTPEVLAELGGLLNLEYEEKRLLSMLLVGSSDLDALVQNDPGMAPRVEVRVQLQPLESDNMRAYVEHRLQAVGGGMELFPEQALEALFKFGRGRPRLLNTLADNALFEAYLAGRPATSVVASGMNVMIANERRSAPPRAPARWSARPPTSASAPIPGRPSSRRPRRRPPNVRRRRPRPRPGRARPPCAAARRPRPATRSRSSSSPASSPRTSPPTSSRSSSSPSPWRPPSRRPSSSWARARSSMAPSSS